MHAVLGRTKSAGSRSRPVYPACRLEPPGRQCAARLGHRAAISSCPASAIPVRHAARASGPLAVWSREGVSGAYGPAPIGRVRAAVHRPARFDSDCHATIRRSTADGTRRGRHLHEHPKPMSTSEFKHHFADLGEVTIHYVTAGAGLADGPPIVLVHGWPQTWLVAAGRHRCGDHRRVPADLHRAGRTACRVRVLPQPAPGRGRQCSAARDGVSASHAGARHGRREDRGPRARHRAGGVDATGRTRRDRLRDCGQRTLRPGRAARHRGPAHPGARRTTRIVEARTCHGRTPSAAHSARSSSNMTIPARRATNTPPPAQTNEGASRLRYQLPSLR